MTVSNRRFIPHMLLLLVLALFCTIRVAHADIIPDLPIVSFVSPGVYEWSYNTVVTTRQKVTTGDFFTIYDFQGYLPSSNFQPEGWGFSTADLGLTPSTLTPTDNPLIPNLTWTWNGQDTLGDGLTEFNLGDFGAWSPYPISTTVNYAGEGTSAPTGLDHANMGPTFAPLAPLGEPSPVPEPASMAVVGLGVPFLLKRFRRRQTE